MGQTPYYGLSHEHPMDHLERFLDLVSAIKANGVLEGYLFCKLFKYSLAGEALHWLKQLQPGSLTSWADIKNAFLCHFFDEARVEDLGSKIPTFTHEPTESFKSSWIRFKLYPRDYPHHGFNEVQLLSTFLRGIQLAYQMALDSASDGNFKTRNPEEAVRLIENLASSNYTKKTDFERKKLAPALGKEQLEDVKAKLDSVHKLLKKQVSFPEDVEAVDVDSDMDEEEDVNFINGSGFHNQRSGNQSGYRNSYNNSQKSAYNQNSQYQKPFSSNYNSSNKAYGSSFYQNPPPQTRESKIASMLNQVLEGQQKLMVNFNGKIDDIYTELNSKFESLNTHVRKLETQVVQTGDTIKRYEAFMKGKGDDSLKHHVNAIMDDDSCKWLRRRSFKREIYRSKVP